jgi:hypothetical protein
MLRADRIVTMRTTKIGLLVFGAILAASQAVAEGMRFELFPEPDVRAGSPNRTATAYVVDKKENQFWTCTVRYNYSDLTANNGQCVKLSADIGRPSLNEAYVAHAVTGSAMVSALLPVIWFIEPKAGDVQFCDIRHAGLCVRMSLP